MKLRITIDVEYPAGLPNEMEVRNFLRDKVNACVERGMVQISASVTDRAAVTVRTAQLHPETLRVIELAYQARRHLGAGKMDMHIRHAYEDVFPTPAHHHEPRAHVTMMELRTLGYRWD